jgi:hypothetical protein
MEAVSANLNWFLQPIGDNLTKPQKKFLRDGLVGLLRAGRLPMSIGTGWCCCACW